MHKPAALRAVLTEALGAHDIARNPDRLHMSITSGRPVTAGRPGTNAAMEFRYTLRLTLLDFAGKPEEVIFPILGWINRWQHELIQAPPGGPAMDIEVEFLDAGKVDLLIDLPLTETVRQLPGGAFEWLEEPPPFAFETAEPLHRVLDEGGGLIARCDHD